MSHGPERQQAPVVVGVDGSDEGQVALDWAAAEAARAGRRLRIVHGFVWPLMRPRVPLGPMAGGPPDGGLRGAAEAILAAAAQRVHTSAPHQDVETELVTGSASAALLERSVDAALLVVGHRGLGGFTGLLVGSVGIELAAHASCAVVIVRSDGHPDPGPDAGRVVVGVDGSASADLALTTAASAAQDRGVGLTVIRSWATVVTSEIAMTDVLATIEADATRELAYSTDAVREQFPDLDLRARLTTDHAGHALAAASAGAELVVVGSRGRGGFTGLLLGSTSQTVIRHAHCPVQVVRVPDPPG